MGSFCTYLWDAVYINRSGEVFACCHQRPKPFGNIYDAPLKELVNSPTARQLRADSLSGSLSCYPSCNLLDKAASRPWGQETPRIQYSSLRFLHISFGEACNIRCVMCDNPQRHKENPVLLDPEVVIRNVDLTPFSQVMLRGGEPLFVRECLRYMDHLEKVGKKYSLLTNGLLIDDARALRLARGAHSVMVSLNGATKKGHESVNRGSRFERVLENVQRLRDARTASGSEMVVAGHMTITTSNLHEVPLFLRSFREFGFDRVNFGYVKETVPPYLATHPEITSQLKDETTAAMKEVGGPDVDDLRLNLLGLWTPVGSSSSPNIPVASGNLQLLPMTGPGGGFMKGEETSGSRQIGDPVLETLGSIDRRATVLAFIRHSERGKRASPADTAMDDVPLTPRGHDLARRFGRELPTFGRTTVSHTNINRSIQTATEIDIGFREVHKGIPSLLTGKDPIFSVIYRGTVDKKLRDEFRASLRGQAFAQMWLDGEVPSTIMRPANETVSRFLQDVETRVRSSPPGSLHVHVGHDREIEVVRTSLLGGKLGDYPLMEFLDGLIFRLDPGGTLEVSWRDRRRSVTTTPSPQKGAAA